MHVLFSLINEAVIYGSYKQKFHLLSGSLAALQIISVIIAEIYAPFCHMLLTGTNLLVLGQLNLLYVATR
jgi:hypothetical protein